MAKVTETMRRRHTRWRPIARRYLEGETFTALGAELGYSREHVRANVTFVVRLAFAADWLRAAENGQLHPSESLRGQWAYLRQTVEALANG